MRPRRDKDRHRRGYTLLEVITAFAVLTIALSALIPMISGLLSRSGGAQAKWAATEFAASKLAEIGVVAPIRQGVAAGTYRTDWRWTATTRPHRATGVPLGAGLYEITIEVRDAASDRLVTQLVTVKQARPGR